MKTKLWNSLQRTILAVPSFDFWMWKSQSPYENIGEFFQISRGNIRSWKRREVTGWDKKGEEAIEEVKEDE
jgi:uncharacterized protein YjcR